MKVKENLVYNLIMSQDEYVSLNTVINFFKELDKEDKRGELFESWFAPGYGIVEISGFDVLANFLEEIARLAD